MVKEKQVQLEDVIGKNGKHQMITFLVSFFSSWFMGTGLVIMDFTAPAVIIYWDWDSSNPNRTTFLSNYCNMDDIMELNMTSNLSHSGSKLIYESQYSRTTLTEKLNLVCERAWLVSLANFLSVLGTAFGSLFLRLSERYGRRPVIIQASIISMITTLCMNFPVGYAMFAASLCVFRASTTQVYMLLFIQGLEIATQSSRSYVGILTTSGLIFGQVVLVGVAWLLKDWFFTQLFQTALVAILMLVVWYIPESPVWLAVRGGYEESKQVLIKIAKRNGCHSKESELKIETWLGQMKIRCEVETSAERGRIADLFKNKRIALIFGALTFAQVSFTFIYYSLMLNAENFGSGLYLDLFSANVLSLLAVLILAVLVNRVSIRLLLGLSFFLEGLLCALYPVVCGFHLAGIIVSVLCRFFVSVVCTIMRLYVNEVLPTSVRAVGSGLTFCLGVVLSSPAPFTKEIAEKTSVYVPFILFAVLSLITTMLYKILPDMKGKQIMHTVNDLKEFGGSEGKTRKSAVYTVNLEQYGNNDSDDHELTFVKRFRVLEKN